MRISDFGLRIVSDEDLVTSIGSREVRSRTSGDDDECRPDRANRSVSGGARAEGPRRLVRSCLEIKRGESCEVPPLAGARSLHTRREGQLGRDDTSAAGHTTLGFVGVITLLAAFLLAGCGKEKPVASPDVVVVKTPAVVASPADPAWAKVPVHTAGLLLQDMVDPRLMEPSTQRVNVQAMTDGTTIAFRLSWDDATRDDKTGPGAFPDGCAVQLPRTPEADLPAPQMGEAGKIVEIAYWRASWQAVVDGRGDTIRDLYPTAAVDHYPFEAASLADDPAAKKEMEQRYAPARALGSDMAGPRYRAAQALIAAGPGSLTPDSSMSVDGKGSFDGKQWAVVITRPVPSALGTSNHGQVAFAVWEGSHDEAGARKMRTGWIPLRRSDG